MVAEQLAMVAHENHNGVFQLVAIAQRLHDAGELIVDLLDHRVVVGLKFQSVILVMR